MPDIKQVLESDATSNPTQVDNLLDMQSWNRDKAIEIANHNGIQLSDDHWRVIVVLPRHYHQKGPAQTARELSEMLERVFADYGGKRFLYHLFPSGPVTVGMRIAGLPAPANSSDGGHGFGF